MAFPCLLRSGIKCPPNVIIFRSKKPTVYSHRPYSKESLAVSDKNTPVKFTTNTAAKISIAENLHLRTKADGKPWFERYVIAGSLSIFLIYFCILREENDIDEILKGNTEYFSDSAALLDLKLKLQYCEKNHLPTAAIKNKIELLEKGLIKPK